MSVEITINGIVGHATRYFRQRGFRFENAEPMRLGADECGRGIVEIRAAPEPDPEPPGPATEQVTCSFRVKTLSEESCKVACVPSYPPLTSFQCEIKVERKNGESESEIFIGVLGAEHPFGIVFSKTLDVRSLFLFESW